MLVPKPVLMLGPVVLPLLVVASGARGLVPGPRVVPREHLGQVCRSLRRLVLVLVEARVSRQAVVLPVALEEHPVPVPLVVLLVVARRVLPLLRRRWVLLSPRLVSVP